jgi:hypothetical protein
MSKIVKLARMVFVSCLSLEKGGYTVVTLLGTPNLGYNINALS